MPYKDLEKRREHKRLRYHINKSKYVKYREDNKEKMIERSRRYYQNNKDKRKEYRESNKEEYNKRERERRKNDPTYKIRKNLSRRMRDFLKGKIKSLSTISIVGITSEGLREHIERQWEPWMSWDNYGLYKIDTFNYGWDIDHIIPTSTATTEEELYKLNHYTNLKPLCSKVNRDIKKDVIFS